VERTGVGRCNTRMRVAVALLVAGLAAMTGGAAWSASVSRTRTVPCDERVAQTRFPYVGNSRAAFQYRTLLDAVSVPPAYAYQVVPTYEQLWAYHRKSGLVVRANGVSVTISVPKSWRSRVAISWGNKPGYFTSVRFVGCGSQPNVGNAYAGGFSLRSASACFPLTVRVGHRSATVRFGLGKQCP
jgi:hypothetical protein